jgi:hypothetical protein
MATNQDLPATDSAAVLHELVGDDATAGFENDPKFSDANPTVGGSSENLQTRADRRDIQAQPDLKLAADEEDEDEDDEDEDEDDDLEDDEDEEDEDDEDEDDEDEDEDDEEYEDDDDEDEDEDDEDEE